MKKSSLLLVLLAALLTAVLLSACGGAEEGYEGMPNPMTETDAAALAAEGLFLPAPEGAEASWFRYDMGEQPPIGEMRFTLDGQEACLRAQRTDLAELSIGGEAAESGDSGESDPAAALPWDISGLYFEWEAMGTNLVKDRSAFWRMGEGAGLVAWVDAGVLYNLTMSEGADQETLISLAEQAFVPVTDK